MNNDNNVNIHSLVNWAFEVSFENENAKLISNLNIDTTADSINTLVLFLLTIKLCKTVFLFNARLMPT